GCLDADPRCDPFPSSRFGPGSPGRGRLDGIRSRFPIDQGDTSGHGREARLETHPDPEHVGVTVDQVAEESQRRVGEDLHQAYEIRDRKRLQRLMGDLGPAVEPAAAWRIAPLCPKVMASGAYRSGWPPP